MEHQRKSLNAKGFTLVEMLVVIAIIALLIAIAVIGFRAIERTAQQRKTKAALANAASMLAEYEAATAFKSQPKEFYPPGTPAGSGAAGVRMTTGFNFWKDSDPASAMVIDPLAAPAGSVDSEASAAPSYPRDASQAVRNTAILMREIEKLPAAQKIISQLPAEATMNVYEDHPNRTVLIGRVLLDAWNNPIIFVPAVGLTVCLGDATDARNPFVVRSNKTYVAGAPRDTALDNLPPSARPFFASAGPDGIFAFIDADGNGSFTAPTPPAAGDKPGGDDNMYSFDN